MKYKPLTDKQRKGFDLVIKFLNKKFPFIVGWDQYKDWELYNTVLFIDLVIDLTKYKDYFDVPINKEYIKVNEPYTSLTQPLSNMVRFNEIYDLSGDIVEKMRNIYEVLPQDYVVMISSMFNNRDYHRPLGISHYRFINPPDEN
jgi:hypothetical protein